MMRRKVTCQTAGGRVRPPMGAVGRGTCKARASWSG